MLHATRRSVALLFGALVLASPSAYSQGYPDKPIKLVVGFAPGGGTDLLARLIGQHLSEKFGQPVIVDNRAGANTVIGTEITAKAAPDGYTLGIVPTPITTNPSLYAKLPYDTSKDFTWITQLTSASLVLLASNSVKANSLQELIALAKKEPGALTYGSGGTGGSPHLATVLLERMAGINMVHVPYKGNALAITDLTAGRLSLLVADIPQVLPYIKSGQVKALAVTTAKRSPALPDVPTVAESGLAGYDVPVWYGVVGPANIPKDIVAKLYDGFKTVLANPVVQQTLSGWGVEPVGSTPEEFATFIRNESKKWAQTIEGANIRLE